MLGKIGLKEPEIENDANSFQWYRMERPMPSLSAHDNAPFLHRALR